MTTKAEVKERFIEEVLPGVIGQYGPDDEVAISEAWSDYTDLLAKAGEITQRQYNTWDTPRFTDRDKLEAVSAGASHGGLRGVGQPRSDCEVLWYARTRGKRYEIYICRDSDGDVFVEEFTQGRSSAVSRGHTISTAEETALQKVRDAKTYDGIDYTVEIDRIAPCDACGGEGWADEPLSNECLECGGEGRVCDLDGVAGASRAARRIGQVEIEEDSVVIRDHSWRGGYDITAEGKHIGHEVEWDDAVAVAIAWMDENQYYPNLYYVNERGMVDLLDKEGNIIELSEAEGLRGRLEEMARSNASMAADQAEEYDSMADAFWAYRQNVEDTAAEMGATTREEYSWAYDAYDAEMLRLTGKGWEDWTTVGGLRPDEEDLKWASFSYGNLPRRDVFNRHYDAIVGPFGVYQMDLNDTDYFNIETCLDAAEDLELSRGDRTRNRFHIRVQGSKIDLSRDGLYAVLECMVEQGAEEQLDLVSSVLQTLNIEWI